MSEKPSTRNDDNSLENQLNYRHSAFEEENDGLLPVTQQDLKPKTNITKSDHLLPQDRKSFLVLVILYLLQGVPVGLAFGSIPFILKSKLSYSQVGIFSLAAYPYSLKLIWSPFVDSIYSKKIGRRKSWIIPIQTISGLVLIYLGFIIDKLIEDPKQYLNLITLCFFILVLCCATQDIAVDGWALTCLSPESLSYASTAQTIGINTGYFSSFTIFLALNSPDFANKYLRSVPKDIGLFTLGQYLTFWGWVYILVTGIVFFIPEDPPHLVNINKDKIAKEKGVYNLKNKWNQLSEVYSSMYEVLKLPNVQTFVVILLVAKLGFQVNEAGTNLKLLEKGLSKEDLSITVLIDFPFEMIFGYYAGRWSNGKAPLRPWIFGFMGRLVAAGLAQLIVYFFPKDGHISKTYFLMIILQHLLGSFMSTIQFVSLCAFHTKIADPKIGGTYMTTLNTLSNYGGTWPRIFIFFLIDKITISKCNTDKGFIMLETEKDKEQCTYSGGEIEIIRDGYYYTNALYRLLQQHLPLRNDIYDFQSTPNCDGMYIFTTSIIISHLKRGNKVIIMDCAWIKYQFSHIKDHPEFKTEFKGQITYYQIDTFGKLYYKISQLQDTNTLIILNGFHQLIDLYKLELSLTYEEFRSKHRLEQYSTLSNNKENNTNDPIPQISSTSQLFKVSPTTKYDSHLNSLISNLNKLCIKNNSMVFLLGVLETKFRQFRSVSSQENNNSSQSSTPNKNRVVLSSRFVHKSVDSRLIFYKDWYHKSTHFLNNHPIEDKRSITINQAILRFVNAVRLEIGDIHYEPLYFDIDDEFFHDDDEEKEVAKYEIIDLSESKNLQNILPPSSPQIDSTVINITANDIFEEEEEEEEIENLETICESEDEQVEEILLPGSATN
ncbi:hypothetical protein KGF54_001916 [Candida jiufengensis]|uniref:uncharacterized protein n=1 Tax=Candida jiufengensis TaxID=497108 RepID=UPI00222469BF|nr:uncharacterized protein KGF54_001916 [Candida jiufengensis]KAI5955355.1 hypothetical protein KGF54_001916 [Candida jiufengensis]